MAFSRCCGITRKGVRCSITATSRLTDEGGRLIGAPLLHGGNYCRLHSRPFCAIPADFDGSAVVLLLDLETTGVDVASDQIIEFAAFDIRSSIFDGCQGQRTGHRISCPRDRGHRGSTGSTVWSGVVSLRGLRGAFTALRRGRS